METRTRLGLMVTRTQANKATEDLTMEPRIYGGEGDY